MLEINVIKKCILIPASKHLNMIPGCRFYLIAGPNNYMGLLDQGSMIEIAGYISNNPALLGKLLDALEEVKQMWNMDVSYHYGKVQDRDKIIYTKHGYTIKEDSPFTGLTNLKKGR